MTALGAKSVERFNVLAALVKEVTEIIKRKQAQGVRFDQDFVEAYNEGVRIVMALQQRDFEKEPDDDIAETLEEIEEMIEDLLETKKALALGRSDRGKVFM